MPDIIARDIDWSRAARICPKDAFNYVIEAPAYGPDYRIIIPKPSADQARALRDFIKAESVFRRKPVKEFSLDELEGIESFAQSGGMQPRPGLQFDYSDMCFVALSSRDQKHFPLHASDLCSPEARDSARWALMTVRKRGHGFFVRHDQGGSAVHAASVIRYSENDPPVMGNGTLIVQTDIWGYSETVPGMQSRRVKLMRLSDLPYHVVFPSGREAKIEDIPVIDIRDGKPVIAPAPARFGAYAL